ncbi:hypothetical protein KIW84_055250 [Lathyrus oleraceus]|uniref:Uncharacterized protein n=1 Tax=Pisum sativum TaxID=3888 RepID=A0A9D4X042_PEA|nr:hypothetical protein KIW84_055250 [Pisum sativum]
MATLLWTPSNSHSLNLNLNGKQSPLKLNANPSLHFNRRFRRFNTAISCNSTNHNDADTKPQSQSQAIQLYSQIERLVTTSARQSQDAWGSADWTEVEVAIYYSSGPAASHLRRKAVGRRPHSRRLQHPEGINSPSGPPSSRWRKEA